MARSSGMTRREMLKGAAGATAAATVGGIAGCFPAVGGNWPEAGSSVCGCTPSDGGAATPDGQAAAGTPLVVTIQRDDSIDSGGKSLAQPQLEAVEAMVNAVLTALAGGANNPWSVIFRG